MNQTLVSKKEFIFNDPLTNKESEDIRTIVNQHKANSAITQQLAIDASKCLATSQERLAEQSKAGFFKRFSNAVTGKTRENQLLNQQDTLQMQKFAWHYLQQLQQQNLLNTQSIAVIRNNLSATNDYIIETRNFLELAIGKIIPRLDHLENHKNLNNWLLNTESNKRRLKSIPKNLLILQLAFDFSKKHQDINLSENDIDNYLMTSLQRLDIDCDEKIHLIEFISEIIDQVEFFGLDRYKQSISISFDEYTLSSDYIQNNISGFAFSSLYFLLDNYEKLNELINDAEICNSDEVREKLISKFFGSEFDNLSSEYSIRNLIYEIVGGIQLAIDIYKDEHGLNIIPDTDESSNEATLEPINLIYSLPEIQAHTFLDAHDSIDLKNQYICSLALCFEERSELNKSSIEFIEAISEKYNLPKPEENNFFEIIENKLQRNNYIRNIPALLDNDNKKYTWLLDAFFLLTVAGRPIETANIKTIINTLKPTQLQKLFSSMRTVVSEEDSSKILEASLNLSEYTSAWKNIIQYRNLNFYDHFLGVCNKLEFITLKQDITSDLFDVYMKGMEHATFFAMSDFDDRFFSKLNDKAAATVCSQGRKSALSELNKIKKKTKDFITQHHFELSQANRIISDWEMKGFDFENSIQEKDFDLDNSAENENWGEYFEKYHRQIETTITSFIQAGFVAQRPRKQVTLGHE